MQICILAVSLLKYSYDISSHSFCNISHTAVFGTSHGPSTSQAYIHLPIILFSNNLPLSSYVIFLILPFSSHLPVSDVVLSLKVFLKGQRLSVFFSVLQMKLVFGVYRSLKLPAERLFLKLETLKSLPSAVLCIWAAHFTLCPG